MHSPNTTNQRRWTFLATPEKEKVEWRSAADDGNSLVILFSSSTNRPMLNNSVSINNAMVFDHGDIKVLAGRGTWSPGGEALTITDLDPGSWNAITKSISDGIFHATARKKPLVGAENWADWSSGTDGDPVAGQLRGNLTIRVSFPGRFVAHLFVGERLDSISAPAIEVDLCPNEVLLEAPKTPRDSGREVPHSVFVVNGIAAFPGDQFLKVRSAAHSHHTNSPRWEKLHSVQ